MKKICLFLMFVLGLCVLCVSVDSCSCNHSSGNDYDSYDYDSYDYDSYDYDSQNYDNNEDYVFHTATDVQAYLMSHEFVSAKGTLTVENLCLYMDGICITGAINLNSFNEFSALMTAVSPYSGTFRMKVDCSDGTLTDLTSGDVYYAQ